MPLVQIDLDRDLYDAKHEQMSAVIHQAQITALGIPADDLFQVFRPHEHGELTFSPTYGGVERQHLTVISMTMVHHHSVKEKTALYRAIVEGLETIGIRREDIQIALVENGYEDWYAGTL